MDECNYKEISVRTAYVSDVAELGPNLREADKNEVYAIAGLDGTTGLLFSFQHSNACYTIEDNETKEPLAMFGTCSREDRTSGAVWFLGSDALFSKGSKRICFLKNSKFWVEKLFGAYKILGNYVDKRNTKHIQWLKWLGFTFIEDVHNFGYEGRTFKHFYKERA